MNQVGRKMGSRGGRAGIFRILGLVEGDDTEEDTSQGSLKLLSWLLASVSSDQKPHQLNKGISTPTL